MELQMFSLSLMFNVHLPKKAPQVVVNNSFVRSSKGSQCKPFYENNLNSINSFVSRAMSLTGIVITKKAEKIKNR
jgi:hypothetical protein